MNRRTFVKAAIGTPILAATVSAETPRDQARKWPETVSFDGPAGHPFPMKFVEELPLVVRGETYASRLEKGAEIFRFTAHEWTTDAALFRGMEIKLRNPSDLSSRDLKAGKLSVWTDGYKVSDGINIGAFMKEGGAAFQRWDRSNSTKVLYATFMGWVDKDGFPDPERFLGYFIPNKTCLSVEVEGCPPGSISVEIKCDMARYTAKR